MKEKTAMPSEPIPSVKSIDRAQWKEQEYDLLYHFVNLERLANSVNMEPGPLQGWFREALWRHYSYAPFNARVMENYHSLAFFYGYEAPWNIYYRHPAILHRLELTLDYTFRLMAENGAIPEYAPAALDSPMLAPSSFGMEYMASALEVAGKVLPQPLRQRLVQQARKAAMYVLTSQESWEHARSFTNQFLGAMAGGARLARLTNDQELMRYVHDAGDALLGEFMSPMGFLYEHSGPETFAYFFVTLHRLITLYKEWPDERVREVLCRHCDWMSRWMLPERDGRTILLSYSHQTRTGGESFILMPNSEQGMGHMHTNKSGRPLNQKGLGYLLAACDSRADFLKPFLMTAERYREYCAEWERMGQEAVEALKEDSLSEGYAPVSTLALYPMYAPPQEEVSRAWNSLPCLNRSPRWEIMQDERGNQYAFFRRSGFYTAFAFSTHRSLANNGPAFLWSDDAGTLALAFNGADMCWQTTLGDGRSAVSARGTAKSGAMASIREGRGGHELLLRYADLGITKHYVVHDGGLNVLISPATGADGAALTERIPLLLRPSDRIYADYGSCLASGLSDRGLGLITKRIVVEREGNHALTIDLGQPVSATLRPVYDNSPYIRTELIFALSPCYFDRTGYQVLVGKGAAS